MLLGMTSAYERVGVGIAGWGRVSRGAAGGWALGRLGMPEVGLDGGGGPKRKVGDEGQGCHTM